MEFVSFVNEFNIVRFNQTWKTVSLYKTYVLKNYDEMGKKKV